MTTIETSQTIRNGIDTAVLYGTLDAVGAQPDMARFQFRVRNQWMGGAHNRSTIQDFYAAGGEDETRTAPFHIDAGEPAVLLGHDEGANPAEFLLHALAACLTTSMVFVAAARKVPVTSISSTVEGDLDVRGALGLDDSVRNGFQEIRITFRISGDASPEKLREVVERGRQRSVVFDSVTRGVPVHVDAVVE